MEVGEFAEFLLAEAAKNRMAETLAAGQGKKVPDQACKLVAVFLKASRPGHAGFSGIEFVNRPHVFGHGDGEIQRHELDYRPRQEIAFFAGRFRAKAYSHLVGAVADHLVHVHFAPQAPRFMRQAAEPVQYFIPALNSCN